MPWKGEKDPYRIWLSEIILQQTRVEQGLAYYNRFVAAFPTIVDLALAGDAAVYKLWEGLGYYSRCRNLIATARQIAFEYQGNFPDNYKQILSLNGVGPYTAAAIASFAYGLPHAVVDGNVLRVLSRYFGHSLPVDTTGGKAFYTQLAAEVLAADQSGPYNQAIMDFGATVCKPQLPLCIECPLQPNCTAYQSNQVAALPVKSKKLQIKTRWMYYFVFVVNDAVLIQIRNNKDIWQHLYEFYLIEKDASTTWTEALVQSWLQQYLATTGIVRHISGMIQQKLTHRLIQGQFIIVQLDSVPPALNHLQSVKIAQINQYPFPRLIHQFLQTAFD